MAGTSSAGPDPGSLRARWGRRLRGWRLGPPPTDLPTLDELLAEEAQQADGHHRPPGAEVSSAGLPGSGLPVEPAAEEGSPEQAEPSTHTGDAERFGPPGTEFNRNHPFYVGLLGAFGVLAAYGVWQVVGQLAQLLTLIAVSVFLALGLEPVVEWLERRGLPRPAAIGAVFTGLLVVVVGFVAAVVPIVVTQASDLADEVPRSIETIQQQQWFIDLDSRYDVVSRLTNEVEKRLSSGETVTALFGGVFGAGAAVVSGVFSTFTVLVLTLYFLASLPSTKAAGYRLVPRSRRRRAELLGDEISSRIGGYVIGQITVASINGVASYVTMLIVGVPYPLVLAVTVGIIGIIPLIGATLGAVVVVIVSLFMSPASAVVMAVYYVVYQQVENYVIVPRIMQRAVAVPGAVAIVAGLAGATLMGLLGALIAIPLAAGILLVVQEVVMPRQERA